MSPYTTGDDVERCSRCGVPLVAHGSTCLWDEQAQNARARAVHAYNEPMSVQTWPDSPLPAGTKIYANGKLLGELGPPLPVEDGSWSNYLIPNPFTEDPDASAPVDEPDPRTE